MLLNERRSAPTDSRFPGAGKPAYTNYNSVTVTLMSTFAQQKGSLKIDAVAADFPPCTKVVIDFKILDQRTSKDNIKCPCHFSGKAELIIPTPAPADLGAYIAQSLRSHSMIASNMVTGLDGNKMNWTMLRAGYAFEATASVNAQGKSVTLTTTITQQSSNGTTPRIEAGPAVWQHPSLTSNSPMRGRVGTTGWTTTPAGPAKPRFMGVLRKEDEFEFTACDCTVVPKDNCNTVIHHGAVHVKLEKELTVWPGDPIVVARHTSDPAILNGQTGGYQIIDKAAAVPAGMAAIGDVQIWDVRGTDALIMLT